VSGPGLDTFWRIGIRNPGKTPHQRVRKCPTFPIGGVVVAAAKCFACKGLGATVGWLPVVATQMCGEHGRAQFLGMGVCGGMLFGIPAPILFAWA